MQTCVVALEPNLNLAKAIAAHLKLSVLELQVIRFADSEVSIVFKDRDTVSHAKHALLVHATSRPVNENLMELLLALRALKNIGVEKITVVIPYFGYARQDKRTNGESVAQFIIRLLKESGADRVVTVELHDPLIAHGAQLPVTNIVLTHTITEHIKKQGMHDTGTIIAPDHGALERVVLIAHELNAPVMVHEKERYDVDRTRIIGSEGACNTLSGIIVDDIIDTGSTILNVDKKLHEEQSACRLFAFAVHAVLSGNAADELQNSSLERIWVTNTIPWRQDALPEKFEVVDISKEIAQHIAVLL